ncbi:hypothetical protein HaLaN_16820 [Haematococcus lacustris]|uniref:Secreted protein n=1 Tax=Haematococcus lacustris TaxID=44745 RepID=A0A699ZV30_HAELA|nr:hypothetical protein HaLaN_16820 [Haematococcus lacustris]
MSPACPSSAAILVVLFVLGPGSQPDHAVALVVALRDIVTRFRGASSGRGPDIEATSASAIPLSLAAAAPAQPARLTSPRDAFFTRNVRCVQASRQ